MTTETFPVQYLGIAPGGTLWVVRGDYGRFRVPDAVKPTVEGAAVTTRELLAWWEGMATVTAVLALDETANYAVVAVDFTPGPT